MPVNLTCQACFRSFSVKPSQAAAKYCSNKCRQLSSRKGDMVTCAACGTEHYKPSKQVKRATLFFCGNDCKFSFSNGPNHPRWKGGRYLDGAGYVYIHVNGMYVYEHRHVMRSFLGRALRIGEHVHHKNGIKTDNSINNLELLSNSDHQKLHATLIGWSKKYDCCVSCGTVGVPHHSLGLCKNCYGFRYNEKRKAQRHAKEDLPQVRSDADGTPWCKI